MTIINAIPDKLPRRLIRDIKKEKYDTVLLFTLAAYGAHEKKELINDSSTQIKNRLDENIFQKWVSELKKSNFVQEVARNDKVYYQITEKGKEELMVRVENTLTLQNTKNSLTTIFDELLEEAMSEKPNDSKSTFEKIISYKDYVFGLLSINWRLTEVSEAGDFIKNLNPNDFMSFGSYLDYNAEHHSNRPALLYENIMYTHREFNDWVNRYANYFLSIGLKKGDKINLFLENRPEFLMIVGAMAKIGTAAALINTKHRSSSLIQSFSVNEVKAFIIGEELYQTFESVKKNLGLTSEKLFFIPDKNEMEVPEGFINLREIAKDHAVSTPSMINKIKGKDPFGYVFTSGTTGLPKASPMRHITMFTSSWGWGVVAMNMQLDDIMYLSLPLYHSNAIYIAWGSALHRGSTIALGRKFSVNNFWEEVKKYNATCFCYIGEICRYLLNQSTTLEDRNHNVYKICGNGLRPEIWKEFKERFGIRYVYEFYGASEIRGMFCNYFNRDFTIGVNFFPYAIVKYDIETDKPLKDKRGLFQLADCGEAGLLLVKITDPTIFAGYTDEDETKKKIYKNPFGNGDSWLNTGDMLKNIGHFHAQFVDRLGDTFRWKGENVSTSEVEGVICSFKEINHSSVYGVKIPSTDGRAGMASIITSVDVKDFNFKDFLLVLKENLPRYAIPKFVRFSSELKTTTTFKIKKVEMKEEGYNINVISEPVYVLLPNSEEYVPLTKEIYENITEGKYRF
ncbi:MAG: long-chain-acyl-CoA synthetase [Candidatus Hermodarchaeota archaeon]